MQKPLPFLYKATVFLLLMYSFIYGLIVKVPALPILNETIRNLFYHVPVWFAMMFCALLGTIFSVRYFLKKNLEDFYKVYASSILVLLFCVPGILTGMLWARFTWGTWWTFQEPKLNGVAISSLIYAIFFLLVSGLPDQKQKASVGSAYTVFSFVMMLLFIMVLPRLTSSLHPGNGGNPAFSSYDLDNRMRSVFYPAVMGWIMLAYWLFDLVYKLLWIEKKLPSGHTTF